MREPEDTSVQMKELERHGHHGIGEHDELEEEDPVGGDVGRGEIVGVHQGRRLRHQGAGRNRGAGSLLQSTSMKNIFVGIKIMNDE